ncbi:VOC family protein [Halomonas beimenensis]|uniref:Actoylglutathione lyase n=1 Tax=Halomonas beimenensis TaxID=475662 RepID=A0A291P360_9GAMM|nr:VOC family protein [Halomonas beimenensis]ATJ81324.1 actoylglutathione lyase [Halomonas beimenensis]
MPTVLGIDHLVLRVTDLAAMLDFYVEGLGCAVERHDEALGLVQLRAGDALIDLVPVDGELGRRGGAAPGAEGHNLDHFCLRLAHFDADRLRAELATHGIVLGEVKRRRGAEGAGPSAYVEDPMGNRVELKGPPEGAGRAAGC